MSRKGWRRVVRAYLLSIGVWCSLSLLTGWQYRIFDKDLNIHSTLVDMVRLAESRGFAVALLTPPLFLLVRRMLERKREAYWYLVYAAGLVPFMLLYVWIRWVLVPPWDANLQKYVSRASHGPLELIRTGFADQITTYIVIIVAAHAYVYFERARRQEMEGLEMREVLAASELEALKMQLHPHFLFNTLNGISTLIDGQGACAKEMILKLSMLLRTALQHSGSDLVTLEEELRFVREYLDLEKMRLGARLTVTWAIEPQIESVLVPQLILQPLVENAIRHGIGSSRDRGWVEISAATAGRSLELRVRNSVGTARTEGNGVGLKNTGKRLRHFYAGEASLTFELSDDRKATTTLRLPVRHAAATADDREPLRLREAH